jgi:hypothetical protein
MTMEQARLRPSGKDIASGIERFSPNKQLFLQKFFVDPKKIDPFIVTKHYVLLVFGLKGSK